MDCFWRLSQSSNDNCNSSSNASPKSNNSSQKKSSSNMATATERKTSSTSGRRLKQKINVGLNTNSDDDVAIQWFSSSSCSSPSSRHSSGTLPSKRKRRSSTSLDDKDPELGLEGPSSKRQHLPSSCYPQNSDPSSSVPSSVYPSPVGELVNEIDTRSSDCAPPSYSLPIPDSPNSIDDAIVPESASISSFETASTTSSVHSESHCNQTLTEQSQPKNKSFDDYATLYCMTPVEPTEPRMCPLPALSWANAQDVWNVMCKNDEQASYLRDSTMLNNHPGLQPRMRAILLDWLIEVCEVYKLHRETYYLAVDYLDRYLSTQKRVQKTHLQLIGITCLFIAAKVEEIYPPKIAEFAYVTDGACQEEDILQYEIILLQALDWNISPMTAMGWVGVYMQLNISNRTPSTLLSSDSCNNKEEDDAFIYPQFSGMEFVQTAQLLDLCSLDVGMGNFPYSVIAAAAISHTFNKETALRVSGIEWGTIQPCARWMEPFFQVVIEESEHLYLMEQREQISSKCGMAHICPNIVTDDSHIIQTHTTSMTMFDRAYLISEQNAAMDKTIKTEASPATGLKCPEGLLTPPASSRKPLDENDEEDDHHVRLTSITTASSQKDNIENVANINTQKTL